ncbi:hypothetical protein IT575_04975 [bacterium]|nr:hypothetical protein [bacterium]
MNKTQLFENLLLLLLSLFLLSGCCLSEAFDSDDVSPGPHNEGDAGDI